MHRNSGTQVVLHLLTRGVAVEGQQVLSAAWDTTNSVASSKLLKAIANSAARPALQTANVCGQANNVRCGHGGARDGVLYIRLAEILAMFVPETTYGASANPGGQDVRTGAEDVDNATVVGERGTVVVPVGSTYGACRSFRCGRSASSIGVGVASCNTQKYTAVDKSGGGLVNRSGVATITYVSDSSLRGARLTNPPRDIFATAPLGQPRVLASLATKSIPAMMPENDPDPWLSRTFTP